MSDATTTLLASWEEKHSEGEDGTKWVSFSSGEPHTRAIFYAVLDRYAALTGRHRPTEESLAAFLGQKVTIVKHGENMIGGEMIVATEGTLFMGSSGNLAILPKRARRNGFGISFDKILDVIPGHSTGTAQEFVDEARAHFPRLKPLTQERLNELPLPPPDARENMLTLCAFGTYRMPDGEANDALVMWGEYDPENDILDSGVVLLRPEIGFSEHGSMYGQQLLRGPMGEVEGFTPITFAEGVELCDLDFDMAYERVIGPTVGVAT